MSYLYRPLWFSGIRGRFEETAEKKGGECRSCAQVLNFSWKIVCPNIFYFNASAKGKCLKLALQLLNLKSYNTCTTGQKSASFVCKHNSCRMWKTLFSQKLAYFSLTVFPHFDFSLAFINFNITLQIITTYWKKYHDNLIKY